MIYLWAVQNPFHSSSSHPRTSIWVAWWKIGYRSIRGGLRDLHVFPICHHHPTSQVSVVPTASCIHGMPLQTLVPRWQGLQQRRGVLEEQKVLYLHQSWQVASSWTPLRHSKDIKLGAKMKSWLRFGNPQRFHHVQIPKDYLKQEEGPSLASRREILQGSWVYIRANREMGKAERRRFLMPLWIRTGDCSGIWFCRSRVWTLFWDITE